MTTFAAVPDTQEIQALTCAAWMTYSDELRELDGPAYAEAEAEAWDRLQAALREIEGLHAASPAGR